MFSITQKPQESVNAEDLESIQNELERCLVEVVTQKWELEQEVAALSCTSPDMNNSALSAGTNTAKSSSADSSGATSFGGKLKSSLRSSVVEAASENSSDGFKGSTLTSSSSCNNTNNNNRNTGEIASGTNSNEDSVSSEESLVSSLTSSTIITANLSELGSQPAQSNSASGTTSGIKRSHRSSNDRPSKRFRQNSSNSLNSSVGGYPKRLSVSKHRSKIVPAKFRNSNEESRPNKKQVPRNSAPDKLWPFVEQFCAAPTEEQMKDLEEMIKSMENDKEYFKIPVLGKKDPGTKDVPIKSDSTPTGKTQRKSKVRANDEETGLGALTQRLVSSFITEADDTSTDIPKSGDEAAQQTPKKKNSKAKSTKGIDISSAKTLERRIRQELEEYDILDQKDEIPYTSEDDEILRELVASQHELLAIQRHNKESMQRLLRKAKKHVEIETERKRLCDANADVIAAYHRLIVAKQRKRNPTKKEKDAAWKALKLQEAIFEKCDELYLSSLSLNNEEQ